MVNLNRYGTPETKPASLLVAALLLGTAPAASAQPLKPDLAGLDVLLGRWTPGVPGAVADTGGTATGTSAFTAEAGGAMVLRRDHTDLKAAGGAAAGGFDQIMMIYPEGGGVHADYSDGTHAIHYTTAVVQAGRSVQFTGAAAAGVPTFRLSYSLTAPGLLAVSFGVAPAGAEPFHPVATGELRRSRSP